MLDWYRLLSILQPPHLGLLSIFKLMIGQNKWQRNFQSHVRLLGRQLHVMPFSMFFCRPFPFKKKSSLDQNHVVGYKQYTTNGTYSNSIVPTLVNFQFGRHNHVSIPYEFSPLPTFPYHVHMAPYIPFSLCFSVFLFSICLSLYMY